MANTLVRLNSKRSEADENPVRSLGYKGKATDFAIRSHSSRDLL
jgi:hypothetical protein